MSLLPLDARSRTSALWRLEDFLSYQWYNLAMEDDLDRMTYSSDIDDADEVSEDDDAGSEASRAGLSDYDIESAGFMDGESDANLRMPQYGNYGASFDLSNLTDRQRDLYDNAYHSAQDATIDFDDEFTEDY